MFSSPSLFMRLLHLLRDNSLNILPFMCIVVAPFSAISSASIGVFVIYLILSQFRDLPFHKFFRRWGYDCFFLQYFDAVIIGNEVGKELFEHRLRYRADYVLMGYYEFKLYCREMVMLDRKYKEADENEHFYQNCYN